MKHFSWELSAVFCYYLFINLFFFLFLFFVWVCVIDFCGSFVILFWHYFIKNEINIINKKNLKNNESNQSSATFQSFQSQGSSLIADLKNKYYSKVAKRLLDPSTSPKTYWSILKTFLNNEKIPVIPPIFYDNKFITDFKQKAEVFNPKPCTSLLINGKIPSECPRKSNESLSSITVEINDIEKIIKNLDPNKPHG